MTPLVSISNVDMRYGGAGGTLAVQGLTLDVGKGEFAAVVGPSGCGKSTLMKLVTGLHIPQAGVVTVAGSRVTKPVSIVGMAFQNPTMLPWLTLRDSVMLPLKIVPPFRQEYRRKRKTEFRDRVERMSLREPSIPYVSNVTGTWVTQGFVFLAPLK